MFPRCCAGEAATQQPRRASLDLAIKRLMSSRKVREDIGLITLLRYLHKKSGNMSGALIYPFSRGQYSKEFQMLSRVFDIQ